MSSSSSEEQWIDATRLNNFALKLGYSQNQIQMVVNRLGPKMTQNELLSELVKLRGSSRERETHLLSEEYCLRHVVIDGGNVAVSYGNKEKISCKGIKICVDWFRNRGHKDITVFTPSWWRDPSPDLIIKDRYLLDDMNKDILCVSCCDDRAILKYVAQVDGVLVSNDNYSKYVTEDIEYENVVENRLLMYSFVNNRFMPPDDPLGRHGPTLEKFLRRSKSHREESRNFKIFKRTEDEKFFLRNKKSLSRIKKGRSHDTEQAAITRTDSSSETALCHKLKNLTLERPKLELDYDKVSSIQKSKQPHYVASHLTLQKHRKLHRQNYDFEQTLGRKNFWIDHPAEKPLESSKDKMEMISQENWFRWMKDTHNSIVYSKKPIQSELWVSEDSALSEESDNRDVSNQICQFPNYSILREKLHFHLSAIFPKEQVETVLNIYPHETRPQKLCAAILSLFPNG
ncbi:endoribonuclease rege-1-like [Centruroides vittatus]|uniref:endoribonuclease rege-1-like n=1 Tax=Centruroides vittatus TaxID=120091 RepID=UPI00350EAC38